MTKTLKHWQERAARLDFKKAEAMRELKKLERELVLAKSEIERLSKTKVPA